MDAHSQPPPADPIAAVTHLDPYPAYARWREGPPLTWAPRLGLWVATRADVIQRLLLAPQLRVRPSTQVVPEALVGAPAGEVFGHLVRMNEGAPHTTWRPVLQNALGCLDLDAMHAMATDLARLSPDDALDDAIFRLPVQTVAHALGFTRPQLPEVVGWMRDFVACLSPLSSPLQIGAAHAAAESLMDRMARLVAATPPRSATLLDAMLHAAPRGARHARPLLANLVGLMSQTCDATAGLLGLSLLASAQGSNALPSGAALQRWMEELVRHDAPVQNTRRFASEACVLEGSPFAKDQPVLLVLAAGQRDPAFNPTPDVFDPCRSNRRLLGFGYGAHACPGQTLAITLATAGLQVLHAKGRHREALGAHVGRFHPSVNARIPRFD